MAWLTELLSLAAVIGLVRTAVWLIDKVTPYLR
jgi:hypothetical protein